VVATEVQGDTGDALAAKLATAADVTGVAIQGEPGAEELVAGLRARGLEIPRDKAVIVITGLPQEDHPEVVLPRVEFNIRTWGEEAAKLILAETSAVVHKRIPVRYRPAVYPRLEEMH
jgi:DNA-binding LacI/PurR family transcriptional regulator